MSAPQENSDGNNPLPNLAALSVDGLNPGQRRLALARAARENATPEEIEAQGIRGDVQQIIRHMNRTPSHAAKRARRNGLGTARKIYEDDSDDEEDGDDLGQDDEEEREEDWFELQWQAMLAKEGLQNANMFVLAEFRQIAHERIGKLKQGTAEWRRATTQPPPKKSRFDLLTSLCTCNELIVEVCKRMRPVDIINLYSISKVFRTTLDNNMRSCIFAWASHMAPTSARIFSSPVYYRWFIEDPAKRLVTAADRELGLAQPGQARLNGQPPLNDDETKVRLIPGLLWLQMVVHREIRVRDIIATLARKGHRLPEGSHLTLKKIWVIMDASTTATRIHLLNNSDFFSDEDLYIAQLFMVKLVLAFNHPNFGPQSSMLMRLMMGQRGLSPLWKLLRGKQYRTLAEIRELKLRYDVDPAVIDAQQGMPLHGVEVDELGTMHFEGWGSGPNHLMRPDELIPLEAARRQLDLDRYVEDMMLFGHVDLTTGNSLVPSLEEMYMSDDELPPAQSDWKSLKQELIHSGCGNADEAYSDDEFDGQGLVRKWDVDNNNNEDRGQRRAADGDGYGGETMAEGDQEGQGQGQRAEGDAGHREMDWNDFLNNPGAYVLGLESGSRAHGAQLEGVDNDGEDMEGWDADGEDDGMPEDEIEDEEEEEEDEEDEEDGEVDINVLVQNLHGGLDLNDDQQQDVVLQEAEQFREESELDSTLYIADEDVGEDERTRKLRDWFRPW
ncbi:hypothetical protein C8A03DRAFT_44228 [Achaetomium macrosporum]|uniref:Uncharacterized protein n=1 Tax=Achaetomium macrosporum TaxID=79813 RepID=A0AAN7HAS5_9PEZI|nr:hypothetical protein C8A03DRAFT_44228 [Achaetomium macrosporum]